jgi:hypothetical protein
MMKGIRSGSGRPKIYGSGSTTPEIQLNNIFAELPFRDKIGKRTFFSKIRQFCAYSGTGVTVFRKKIAKMKKLPGTGNSCQDLVLKTYK